MTSIGRKKKEKNMKIITKNKDKRKKHRKTQKKNAKAEGDLYAVHKISNNK